MSKFKYNKHGYTNFPNISKILYEYITIYPHITFKREDADDFIKRVCVKTHGPPPPKVITGMSSNIDNYAVDTLQSINRPLRRARDADNLVLKQAIEKFDN